MSFTHFYVKVSLIKIKTKRSQTEPNLCWLFEVNWELLDKCALGLCPMKSNLKRSSLALRRQNLEMTILMLSFLSLTSTHLPCSSTASLLLMLLTHISLNKCAALLRFASSLQKAYISPCLKSPMFPNWAKLFLLEHIFCQLSVHLLNLMNPDSYEPYQLVIYGN